MAFRFYFMKKDIEAKAVTTQMADTAVEFQSKMTQAVHMLRSVAAHFAHLPILVVTDSWFGNNGLFRPLNESEYTFNLLSRLRSNIVLYDLPSKTTPGRRGVLANTGKGWVRRPSWPRIIGTRRKPVRFSSMASSGRCSPMTR